MIELDNIFFSRSVDILKGYKSVYIKLIKNEQIQLSRRNIMSTPASTMMENIISELDAFISQYIEEASIMFGDYENNNEYPIVLNAVSSALTITESLSNYVEGLLSDYEEEDEGYQSIVKVIQDFYQYLQSRLYEIEDMNIFENPFN
jgi:hypothetical protein